MITERSKTRWDKFKPLVVGGYTKDPDGSYHIITEAGPVRSSGQGYVQFYSTRPATQQESDARRELMAGVAAQAKLEEDARSAALRARSDASGNY